MLIKHRDAIAREIRKPIAESLVTLSSGPKRVFSKNYIQSNPYSDVQALQNSTLRWLVRTKLLRLYKIHSLHHKIEFSYFNHTILYVLRGWPEGCHSRLSLCR